MSPQRLQLPRKHKRQFERSVTRVTHKSAIIRLALDVQSRNSTRDESKNRIPRRYAWWRSGSEIDDITKLNKDFTGNPAEVQLYLTATQWPVPHGLGQNFGGGAGSRCPAVFSTGYSAHPGKKTWGFGCPCIFYTRYCAHQEKNVFRLNLKQTNSTR